MPFCHAMDPLTVSIWIILAMNLTLLAMRRNEKTDENAHRRFKSLTWFCAVSLMSCARVYLSPTLKNSWSPWVPSYLTLTSNGQSKWDHLPPQAHACPSEMCEKDVGPRDKLFASPDLNPVVCLFCYWFNHCLHTALIKDLIWSLSKASFLVMPSQWAIEVDYSKKAFVHLK